MKQWICFGLGAMLLSMSCTASVGRPYAKYEYQKPTKEQMISGKTEYTRYCAACHAKDGSGRDGPALKGSLIATGPIGSTIHMTITGGPHSKMPMWGLTELSDATIAQILTYVRNAWGNSDKKVNGKHAGGVITPELVKKYRDSLPNRNSNKNVRT